MSHTSNALSVRPLEDRFTEEELAAIRRELRARGLGELPSSRGEVEELFADVDEGALDELLERLQRVGVTTEIFLPVTFQGTLSVPPSCGSAHALRRALDALRPELGLDATAGDRPPRLARQRNLWRRFRAGAKAAIANGLVLELVRD